MSGGAIAGIIIGSIIGVVGLIYIATCMFRKDAKSEKAFAEALE